MKNIKLYAFFLVFAFIVFLLAGCVDYMIGTDETGAGKMNLRGDASWEWDMIDKSMASWNVDDGLSINKAWILSKGKNTPNGTVKQEDGYVNLTKTNVGQGDNYAFLVPPALTLQANTVYTFEVKARVNPIDKKLYPDVTGVGFESNQISARLNNKLIALHLKYGDDDSGYITIGAGMDHDGQEKYKINTSEWNVYRFVFHADNLKYDVYINDVEEPIFEAVPTTTMTGSNILRLGAETRHRCNMDIEHVRMGTGNFSSKPKIVSVNVSSDSHIANNERVISVAISTVLIGDDEKLLLSLVDENNTDVVDPVEVTVSSDKVTRNFTIPASVPIGKYYIKVTAPDNIIDGVIVDPKTVKYVVTDLSPITTKMLPQVKPVGFIKEMDHYTYRPPSKEFIFPSILDVKKNTVNNKFLDGKEVLDRYYLFYTPHENPGGVYLATGPTLDGPWTEQGTVIDLEWAQAVPNNIINTADHISTSNVIWNDIQDKFFMYFHGPNSVTHYATSDNLTDWVFGGTVLTSKQFSPIGQEASYAKVFEHEIPGLNNKYVLILMNQEGGIRRIYWAHSEDGVNWTPVQTPLISPDLDYKKIPGTDIKPDYVGSMGNNISSPFLLEENGRYFVLFHGSSGNICVVEVGEGFDMEVHWGEYMKASDVLIDSNNEGNPIAVSRIAAPAFIQNDEGKWYMFFEAGSRLGANIAYAKEGETGNPVSARNYKVKAVNVSCPGGSDGQIEAIMEEAFNYTVTVVKGGNVETSSKISGTSYNLYGLSAGVYQIYFEIDNFPDSRQYFEVVIDQPLELSVFNSGVKNNRVIYELGGGTRYKITHNGITTETSDGTVQISLQKGRNVIRITTDRECQGIYEESVFLD